MTAAAASSVSFSGSTVGGWCNLHSSTTACCSSCQRWERAGLLSRLRVPQVVILIVGGILVGPQVLGWAEPEGLELISNVGLGLLFLLAG